MSRLVSCAVSFLKSRQDSTWSTVQKLHVFGFTMGHYVANNFFSRYANLVIITHLEWDDNLIFQLHMVEHMNST
jgi:hypothetical protein